MRLQMLQVARLAPKLLGDSAALVTAFLQSQHNADGGYSDRDGKSDLYYSVFAIEGLMALRAAVPFEAIRSWLIGYGDGAGLDMVHVACLARCWADLPPELRDRFPREAIARRIESYRSLDGGYHQVPESKQGTLYGCFLASAAYHDLDHPAPQPHRMLGCVESLRADDGGYANQHDMPMGLTPSTAAAVTLLHDLEAPIPAGLDEWLLARCRADGGFFATPTAPMPDLLSTATALHALSLLKTNIDAIREPCLDFIDMLWTTRGGFVGSWADEALDCEYTYYGLLALGHLTL